MIRFAKLALLIFLATAAAARAASPEARLGINLAGPADWMTELPFVDVFRTSRPWISQRKGAAWGQGPELVLDELGWVKKLDADCFAESMLCTVSTTTAHPPTIPSSTPRFAGPASTDNGWTFPRNKSYETRLIKLQNSRARGSRFGLAPRQY